MFKRTHNPRGRREWPEIDVLLRRVRMNTGAAISPEQILTAAAMTANNSGLTPYEVLILWVRRGMGVMATDCDQRSTAV